MLDGWIITPDKVQLLCKYIHIVIAQCFCAFCYEAVKKYLFDVITQSKP
ncbi:hypothetical protein MCHI_002899 [Candidatus Magnetoovum chiemensis]|nr:hypothetical protein MCHI_002899 [Candidatus Magnetoovum chiemensis]